MNRIAFMIVCAIIGILAAFGIIRFMSEPAPTQLVQPIPEQELALPAEEETVRKEDPLPQTPAPVPAPENKQQVMPQPKPAPIRINTEAKTETEVQYETRGN